MPLKYTEGTQSPQADNEAICVPFEWLDLIIDLSEFI